MRVVECPLKRAAVLPGVLAAIPYRLADLVPCRDLIPVVCNSGKGREVAIHAKLRPELEQWLTERGAWPGAGTSPALFLNTKGGRLSVRTDSSVIAAIADDGGLDEETTAHVLRHTFATTLVRGGTDLVLVAELMGHARLETTRQYSLPTEEDKADALNLLTTDH